MIDHIVSTIGSVITGLIAGLLSFVVQLLDGLDSIDGLFSHGVDSITTFFTSFLSLGTKLFPFVPSEWMTIIEASLIVLAVGLIIRKKVVG